MQTVVLESLLSKSFFSKFLPWLVFVLVSASLYFVFIVAPEERVMGAVQKVFYFHVGAAITSYLLIAVLLTASVFYLLSRREAWDFIADGASSVGLLFCTIVLASGMIWGKSAWNTWWRWEPRLVSFLVLWAILFSHRYIKWQKASAAMAAVVGVLAAVNVPIVVFSVKFLTQSEQLHPQVVAEQGLRSGWYVFTLLFCTFSLLFFAFWLLVFKTKNVLIFARLRDIKRNHG